jgi:hypothetical protein
MSVSVRVLSLFLVGWLLVSSEALSPAANDQPLKVLPTLLSERYCYGDAEVFSVWLKLRMQYINQSDRTLILDKQIGQAWYGVTVARTMEDLVAQKYEYNPNIDWIITDEDKRPPRPSPTPPSKDFVILAPGQSFESETDASVMAQYGNAKQIVGTVQPGSHIFQMELSAWSHPGNASEFKRRWSRVGQLVTEEIDTEPLEIRVPTNPKLEMDCK